MVTGAVAMVTGAAVMVTAGGVDWAGLALAAGVDTPDDDELPAVKS